MCIRMLYDGNTDKQNFLRGVECPVSFKAISSYTGYNHCVCYLKPIKLHLFEAKFRLVAQN